MILKGRENLKITFKTAADKKRILFDKAVILLLPDGKIRVN